mgnify:FL=1
MNTQLLKKLYSIHSPSGKEQNMIRFLRSYIGTLPGNISVSQDRYGNLYVIKGTGENYPCLVSHIDQVAHCHHSKDFKAIETKDIIFGYSPGKRRFENPGADDKNGIFICLECLKKYDTIKIAFFREEETGCAGSSNADMPFFNDVRFVIQPDRKGNSDLITSIGFSELCSDEFIKAVKPEEWGYKENNGLLTDVMVLKGNGMGVSCVNLSCGYYNAHSDHEITVKKDLMKGLLFVEHIIEDLLFIEKLRPEMIGIGPFLPHHDTPFAEYPSGTAEQTILLLSIFRLMHPSALIPATTALATLIPDGRERGILAGANVVMPNLSPREERRKYELYNDKASLGAESAEGLAALQKQLKTIGYEISTERGDFKYTTENI